MTQIPATIHLTHAFERLAAWCRTRGYAGHDPFDALNSRVFQALPFARASRVARLGWTQAFKRSPVSLRRLAFVPAERNTKGTALFALGWLARWRVSKHEEAEGEARGLLDDLLAARLTSPSGAGCWGYNFDWQGRAFFAPRGTPTVVPTAFAVRALVEGWLAFRDERYLRAARGACDFILNDLNRSEESADELCFSYTPLDQTRVFNASLLAAEALATVGALTGEEPLKREAMRAARYVARRQRVGGSWAYG
ncbi:MAG: delta-aminolevulinic acid dehydratase, partial [Pyrinomonadaceae bacterium]